MDEKKINEKKKKKRKKREKERELRRNKGVTPQIPGCLVDHRQPAENCVSHIMRPIHE